MTPDEAGRRQHLLNRLGDGVTDCRSALDGVRGTVARLELLTIAALPTEEAAVNALDALAAAAKLLREANRLLHPRL